jgi:aminoglycoside phosphotransferase family enzyme/predicted kinase
VIGEVTEDQSAILALLGRPETYGLPARAPVQRIDTHTSHIFLAGERAYKMKRAVRYPYLDYGTLDRRHWAVGREVELNRRTVPSLYLGVIAVRRGAGGELHLDLDGSGVGEPAEWLVLMRRFPADALLDYRAEHGLLTLDLMRQAAAAIAAFHRDAEIAPDGAGSAAMRAVIAENFEEFRDQPALFEPAAVAELEARTWPAFDRISGLLDRRRAGGQVRQCHGDLHLRNICIVDGVPMPFDCIEFNDDFARIDVLYDLAFLLMDLAHRDLGGLANVVVNEYAKGGREIEGLAALPAFMAIRAAVRAKVAGAAIAVGGAATAPALAEISAYLALASGILAPVRPLVVAVGGLPGTGKTTVARKVAPHLGGAVGALHWRSDVVRKQLARVDELTRLPGESYTKEASGRVYAEMMRLARETVRAGQPVILDAAFLDPAERQDAEAMAREKGADFAGFWLEAPIDELRRRLAARTGDASDATPAVLDKMLRYELGTVGWHRLDAGRDQPERELLERLRRGA